MNVPATQPTIAVSRFTPDQVALIKRTICKGATDDELRMFLYQADRTGLDPFARQIYSIERRERRGDQWVAVRSIQTSIDGFRLIAERSGKYAGQVGPHWCGADGQWLDVWISNDAPAAARVGVLRTDFKEPCWGVARFDAYAQKKDNRPTRMWAAMGDVMIAKCAESLALRKAFPQELSGLYTADEMEQAENVRDVTPRQPPKLAPNAMVMPPHDKETGELIESAAATADAAPVSPPQPSAVQGAGAAISIEDMAREAASRGEAVFKMFYKGRSKPEQAKINALGDELRSIMEQADAQDGF